jgi:tubulin beta
MAYESEIDSKVRLWVGEKNYKFADWIPNNIHMTITEQQPWGPSSSMLINSRNVSNIFERWSEKFTAQFRRKAFIYHYLAGGMDEMEFT